MKNVLIVMSSNRDLAPATEDCVRVLRTAGAGFQFSRAGSDVAQVRNYALSKACEALREHPQFTVVLMMDDDIVLQAEDAAELTRTALELGQPCSAVYGNEDRRMCGGLWLKGGRFEDGTFKWRMGLGALAIPREQLLLLEQKSASYETPGSGVLSEFTWSEAEDGEWIAEDFRLCQRLGGVRLLPLEAGHVKRMTLWPDASVLRTVRKFQSYTGPHPMPMDEE